MKNSEHNNKTSLKLLGKEREILRPIFSKEFDSELPDETQANILAAVEDGNVVGFLMSEVLIRVGLLWVHPKKRGIKGARIIKQLAEETIANIPHGASVICIGDNEIFERLGMRKVEGTVYRRDF